MELKYFNFSKDVLELIIENNIKYLNDYDFVLSGANASLPCRGLTCSVTSRLEIKVWREYIDTLIKTAEQNKNISIESVRYNVIGGIYNNDPGLFYQDVIKAYTIENKTNYLNQYQISIIYSKAYEQGHSCGYSEVLLYMDDLIEFIIKIQLAADGCC